MANKLSWYRKKPFSFDGCFIPAGQTLSKENYPGLYAALSGQPMPDYPRAFIVGEFIGNTISGIYIVADDQTQILADGRLVSSEQYPRLKEICKGYQSTNMPEGLFRLPDMRPQKMKVFSK